MGLETRHGKQCYYRKKRVDGRVVSTYVASGAAALQAAEIDRAARQRRMVQRERLRSEQEGERRLARQVWHLRRQIKKRVDHELETRGFRSHRGCWRKPMKANALRVPDALPPEPDHVQLLVVARSCHSQLLEGWVHTQEEEDAVMDEIELIRTRLRRDHPSAAEALLIETVISTYLIARRAESLFKVAQASADFSFERFAFAEEFLRKAYDRHNRALLDLARASKLLSRVPTVQLNIAMDGGRQVNVGHDAVRM